MDAVYQYILPYLPPDLQAILLNPPSLSNPSSLFNVLRIAFPYAKWVVVVLAVYIVWSFVAGIVGYFSRFLRFAMRIGPIIGFVAWIMAATGQGGLNEVLDIVKQWTGLSAPSADGGASPGIASLVNLLGLNQGASTKKRSTGGKSSYSTRKPDPISGRTRSRKTADAAGAGDSAADILSHIVDSATGGQGVPNDWQNMVQDYVKKSVTHAAGLDWLFGGGQNEEHVKEEKKSFWRTR